MLQIDEEVVLSDLSIIRSKLDNASLEECVETLQLLIKSLSFLKKKRLPTYSDNEWNEYCRVSYNLGRLFVDLIESYNNRLFKLINERYEDAGRQQGDQEDDNSFLFCVETLQLLVKSLSFLKKNKSPTYSNNEWSEYCRVSYNLGKLFSDTIGLYNDRLFRLTNERYEELMNGGNGGAGSDKLAQNYGTPNSITDYNQSQGSGSSINRNSLNVSGRSYDVYYYPPSPNPVTQGANSYPLNSSSKNVHENENVIDVPNNIIGTNPVDSPTNSYIEPQINLPNGNSSYSRENEIQHSISTASQSVAASFYSNAPEEDDNEEFGEDGIIGKYLCIKEFKAKEDFQIDLNFNDIVTIIHFSGKYILGKNCRSDAEGLFPIYYIDSLDGNYIFFRCKEDMEFASVNDEVFLLRVADHDYYNGYNITKGEQGIFNIKKLEPIIIDDKRKSEIEALYEDKSTNDTDKNSIKASDTINSRISINSSINDDFDIIGSNISLVDPLRPTNGSGSQISSIKDEYIDLPEDINNINSNKIDKSIVEKLLDYYKTIPNIQENNNFNKEKTSTDNNLGLMQDAVKKLKEFRSPDGKDMLDKKDSFLSPHMFEDIETKKKKWEANRYRCQELVETEKSYCDKMKIMIEKFMKPLEAAVETDNEMLNRVQISLIFKNIPDIYEFSNKLHQELAEAFSHYDEEGPIPIATVFLNKFSDWKIYIKYVEDFHSASATLENLKKRPQTDRFNRFMEQCQKSEECNKSHLKDLIVLPIQRFLKYRLLFEGIKKDSDPRDQESYRLLDTVENYIFEIGEIMNNAKRIQENINKVFSLEKTIMNYPPELISYTQRSFIAEWHISEIKQKKLYLFSDIVLFANILSKKLKKGRKYKYIYEKRINILDYDIVKNTSTSKRVIKFKETDRVRNSKTYDTKSNRSYSSHSHSLLGFSLGGHSMAYSVPITKSLIFFETEEDCTDFFDKYNEQKALLMKNNKN